MASALRTRRPSLLSYLQGPAAGAAVKLCLLPSSRAHGEKAIPFNLLDDAGPVSRLIEAEFVTDAGLSLKKVVLEVQKDRYALAVDESRPVTNRDIDAAWRDSLSAQSEDGVSGLLLSCQIDSEGSLTPLEPLFFCRESRVFFHPFCPRCGSQLQLCSDDELLKRFGLALYSRSLKRYLHCPQCTAEGSAQFYVYEVDHSDHVTVKDRWTLIEEFREIDSARNKEHDFPCAACLDHAGCYGAGSAFRQRIIPFSFYPFYLLASESPSLNALDFLHLVSGATFDEVAERLDPQRAPGRVAKLQRAKECGVAAELLFPRDDERSFLELLFLKISFLRDLLHELMARPELRRGRIRSDRIWVQLPARSAAFPTSWAFKVEVVGEINPSSRNGGMAALTSVADLGLFWFQVLCQNSTLDQAELFEALSEWLTKDHGRKEPSTRKPAIISCGQIFWHPERCAVKDEWRALWDRACDPGYLLLERSRNHGVEASCQELIEGIDALRLEVQSIMFQSAPRPVVQPRATEPAVASAAGGPVHEMRSGMEKARHTSWPPPAPNDSSEDDETMETVILSPDSPRLRKKAAVTEVELDETVMLPSSRQGDDAGKPQRVGGGLLETLLGSARTISARSEQEDEISLLETVIAALPSRGKPKHPGPEGEGAAPKPQVPKEPSEEEKLLEETIFVPPPGRPRPR